MSTTVLVILAVVGSGIFLGLVYVAHNAEKKRRVRALLTANLTERIQQIQQLIDAVPPNYLRRDTRLLLLEECKRRTAKLLEIANNQSKAKQLSDQIDQTITQTQADQSQPPPPQLRTSQEAEQLRNLLMAVTKTLESLVQQQSITSAVATQHINQIQNLFVEANIGLDINTARAAQAASKNKLAIHHYQKALTELTRRNQNNQFAERIAEIRNQIEALQEQTGITNTAQDQDGTDELSKGVENLIEDDTSWKKKYF
jgi:hypothetical protein